MLFFKQIKQDKLSDQPFNVFYKKECHICSVTIKVITRLEENKDERDIILRKLDISLHDYKRLKSGDYCHPEQVLKLCRHLDLKGTDQVKNCKRN